MDEENFIPEEKMGIRIMSDFFYINCYINRIAEYDYKRYIPIDVILPFFKCYMGHEMSEDTFKIICHHLKEEYGEFSEDTNS